MRTLKPTITFVILIHFVFVKCGNAQYFQWAKDYFEKHGVVINDMAADASGNSFMVGQTNPTTASSAFFLVKVNAAGFQQWKINKSPVNSGFASANCVAVDGQGNCYVTGKVAPAPGAITFSGLSVTAGSFLAKFSPQGVCLRLDSLGNTATDFSVTTDTIGNVYLTNGLKTRKIDSNGLLRWENTSYGGNEIGVDAGRQVYLLSANSLVKLNNLGGFSWTFPYGGLKMATDITGNSFVTCNDSIFKVKNSGVLLWSNKGFHGNDIALDNSGKIYLAVGNNLRKIGSNGNSVIWSRSAQNAYFKVITIANGNCLTGGEFAPVNETVICPFHFTRVGVSSQFQDNKGFITKLNLVNPIPFQANIYTPPIAGDRLCSGVYFEVPYFVSLNSNSSFGVGNQFRAQLINPVSGDTTDIGPADSAFIPLTANPSAACRIRVVSTNPIVIGDPNSPQLLTADLILEHLDASINPSGNVLLCSGNSLDLHAGKSSSNGSYFWYKNAIFLNSGVGDSIQTIQTAGDYYYDVYTSDFNCKLSSAVVSVSVVSNPSAIVSASGPLSFCNGDSVVLTTALVTGNLYQWKKNAVNIPGEVSNKYTAISTGNYKVKVTNSNGCTALSPVSVVTVNCKSGQDEQKQIRIFPQPFQNTFSVSVAIDGLIIIKVYDMALRQILEKAFSGPAEESIDMKGFTPGIYQMQVVHGQETNRVKLIKEN